MTKNSVTNWLLLAIYLSLAIPMFYFIDGAIMIGGFGFMYHYLAGAGIVLIGFILFLILPDIRLLFKLSETSFVMVLSYILPLVLSLFLWAIEAAETAMMIKGAFYSIYVILAVMVSACTIYLLRNKAILISCIAMSIANIMIIAPVATEGGMNEFMNELISLIVTFGEDTGPLMKTIEIHDLTFAFGLYLMYAIINKDVYGRRVVICLSLIFSMTGLKRIAAAGIVIGVVLYNLLIRIPKKTVKRISLIIIGLIIATSFIYITAVQRGLFDYLEIIGMDTKGRNLIYSYISKLCDVNPAFLGHGLGFSGEKWKLPLYSKLHQDAYHNEFLKMFVELGFSGYFIWIFSNLPYRYIHMERSQGKKGGLLFLGMAIYCYITYATDNTYYYYYTNMAIFLLAMYPLGCSSVSEIRNGG